jgi:membrane-associated HD superfamily phosphohydrolase
MYPVEINVLYRNLLLAVFAAFLIAFSFLGPFGSSQLLEWNIGRMGRFSCAVCVCILLLACAFQLPFLAVPVSLFAVILTILSGGGCGLISYCVLILLYGIFYQLDIAQMFVLLLTGLAGVLLFSGLDKSFRYVGSLFAYLVGDFTCYSLFFVMTESLQDLGDALLYTAIRLFAALITVLILLKILSDRYVYRDEQIFAVMNDPEYKLLTELREVSKEAYFHAVHTAYLSDKIARKLGINAPLAKAGGYYHKIGLLQGKDTIQNTILVGTANHFPKSLLTLLKEYGVKNSRTVSKEAAVVQLSDAVVASISYLFLKDKNAVLNYEKIIDVIIKKKIDSGDFDHCSLTMEELGQIKKGFTEEKLYYDFLR